MKQSGSGTVYCIDGMFQILLVPSTLSKAEM